MGLIMYSLEEFVRRILKGVGRGAGASRTFGLGLASVTAGGRALTVWRSRLEKAPKHDVIVFIFSS